MSLNIILHRFIIGLGLAACNSPLEAEQQYGDGGIPKGGSPTDQLTPSAEENCYTADCSRFGCTLYDDYAGSELDACKWNIRAGSPYLRDGYLRLAQSAIESAPGTALETTPNSDSLCPKLSTEFRVRQAGTGYAELHFKLDDKIAVYAHPLGDLNKRWLSIACLANGENSPMIALDMSKWNTLRVEVKAEQEAGQEAEKANEARLYRNGEVVGSVSCPPPARAGKIDLQAFGELTMEIDYVQQWCGG